MAILTGSWVLDLVLLLGSTVAGIYLYFLHATKYWKKFNVPVADSYFPMGSMRGMFSRAFGEVMRDVYRAHEGQSCVGMYTMFTPALLVRDPEVIKQIFVKDFNNFRDRGIYVNEEEDPLAAHLFALGGPKWKILRNKMTPTFTSGKMKMMYPTLVESSNVLKEVLDEPASKGEVIEVKDIMARFTTDIISSCAFGIQTNSLKDPDAIFRQMGRKIFEPKFTNVIKGLILILMPEVGKMLKLTNNDKEVREFFLKAVKDTMTYREENKVKRNDFMQLLIQLKNTGRVDDTEHDVKTTDNETKKGEYHFTFFEAAAQAFVFFIAGFETSSTTAQFALYELALHQDIQDKLREEIQTVLAKHDNQMTYEAVQEMDYLQRVIDETLRKYPPLPSLQRECNTTHTIPGTNVLIEKGVQVQIPVYGIHTDPRYYPEPERFDPERFTEEGKATRHHYAYLPFGEGPRNCIGMRFGLMQTKVGLITFLNNYRVEVAKETLVPMKLETKSFILSPEGGMHLKITKTNN